jgi:hypothetical protein
VQQEINGWSQQKVIYNDSFFASYSGKLQWQWLAASGAMYITVSRMARVALKTSREAYEGRHWGRVAPFPELSAKKAWRFQKNAFAILTILLPWPPTAKLVDGRRLYFRFASVAGRTCTGPSAQEGDARSTLQTWSLSLELGGANIQPRHRKRFWLFAVIMHIHTHGARQLL